MILTALKRYLGGRIAALTAVVTVTDDGGSSGRLREELQVLPPGDIRNCLVALAEVEPLMAELFQFRFPGEGQLAGHSFGNLFLAALTQVTGNFLHAIRISGKVLAVRGTILPSTLDRRAARRRAGRRHPRPGGVEHHTAGRAHPAGLPRASRCQGATGGVRGHRPRGRGGPGAGLALHEPDSEPPGRWRCGRAACGGGAQDLRGEPDDGTGRDGRDVARGSPGGGVRPRRARASSMASWCTGARFRRTWWRGTRGRARAPSGPIASVCARWESGSPRRIWRAPPSWRGTILKSLAAPSRGSSGTAAPPDGR